MWSGPRTDSAAALVSSFIVDAGISARPACCRKTAAPLVTSSTDPDSRPLTFLTRTPAILAFTLTGSGRTARSAPARTGAGRSAGGGFVALGLGLADGVVVPADGVRASGEADGSTEGALLLHSPVA